jgi:hypothetical protein
VPLFDECVRRPAAMSRPPSAALQFEPMAELPVISTVLPTI